MYITYKIKFFNPSAPLLSFLSYDQVLARLDLSFLPWLHIISIILREIQSVIEYDKVGVPFELQVWLSWVTVAM